MLFPVSRSRSDQSVSRLISGRGIARLYGKRVINTVTRMGTSAKYVAIGIRLLTGVKTWIFRDEKVLGVLQLVRRETKT